MITRQQKRNGKLLKKQQPVIPAKPLVTDSEAATSTVIESTESGNTSTEATPALEDGIVGEEDTLTAATPATDNDVHENTSIEEVVITDDKVAEPIITEEAEENDECESGIQGIRTELEADSNMQESDSMMKFIEELKPVTEGTERQEFVKDVESDTTSS